VYGACHATPWQQFGVGGIDDHIHILLFSNVSSDALNFHNRHVSFLFAWGVKR
jgi:hypothetical protein